MPWGEQILIDFGGGNLTVSPEEHDMKVAVVDGYNDAIIEMVEVGEEEWDDVLDEYDVEEDRREQLRVVADAAVDVR